MGKDALAIMKRTPRALARLTEGLTPKQLSTNPASDKWCITQLVCHLTDTEIVLGFRLRMAIAESGNLLQAIDQEKWATRLGYENGIVADRLGLFSELRRENVRLLNSLPHKAWKRYGMHTERGKETVARMAQMYAGHDLNHIAQIRTIRRMFRKGSR